MKCEHKWQWAAILNVSKEREIDAIKEINLLFYCKKCLAMKEKSHTAKNDNLKGTIEYETSKIINKKL